MQRENMTSVIALSVATAAILWGCAQERVIDQPLPRVQPFDPFPIRHEPLLPEDGRLSAKEYHNRSGMITARGFACS